MSNMSQSPNKASDYGANIGKSSKIQQYLAKSIFQPNQTYCTLLSKVLPLLLTQRTLAALGINKQACFYSRLHRLCYKSYKL